MKKVLCVLIIAACLGSAGCSRKQVGETINGLEPVTLQFIFLDSKFSATDQVWNAIADRFRNELNVYFDIQAIPLGDYKDRMLVKFAAGEVWDLNFDGDWLQYYQANAMNGYMDLTDLLPLYAPDLYRAYQSSGALEEAKINGRVYSLPWGITQTHRPFFGWRGDLAPDIDPSAVSTVEDVERVVYDLRQRYPDRFILARFAMEPLYGKHDLIGAGYEFAFNINDPSMQIMHFAETAAYLEGAQYAEKWQRDGIIRADVLVDQLDENWLVSQGRQIAYWATHEGSISQFAYIEPDVTMNYALLYPDKKFPVRSFLGNVMGIPRTYKNAERTLMFLNLLETSQELYDMVMYGIEGVTYVKDTTKPNTVMFPPGMDTNNSNFMCWLGQWGLYKPQFMRGDPWWAEGFWEGEREFVQSNPTNITSPLEGFNFVIDGFENEVAQMSAIFTAADKMFTVGMAGDSQRAITQLINDLNRAGLSRVKTEYQRQIDVFMASKR